MNGHLEEQLDEKLLQVNVDLHKVGGGLIGEHEEQQQQQDPRMIGIFFLFSLRRSFYGCTATRTWFENIRPAAKVSNDSTNGTEKRVPTSSKDPIHTRIGFQQAKRAHLVFEHSAFESC